MTRRLSKAQEEEARRDDPANYEETIVSLTAEPICPECSQGQHRACIGQALYGDRIVPCYCPSCGAGDA
jgi:hypothetical protein